jgi:hypothetical protein
VLVSFSRQHMAVLPRTLAPRASAVLRRFSLIFSDHPRELAKFVAKVF